MSSFQLNLLGPVQIVRDEVPIRDVTSPKIVALLAFLAVEHQQAHGREALAELLWPGLTTGRQNLRQSLSRLHKSMEQSATDVSFLISNRQTISLNPAACQCVDVNHFLNLLDDVRGHDHPELVACDACRAQLDMLVACYRGDFLDGLYTGSPAFDEWALLRREWLRQEFLWASDVLTQCYLARQDAEQALVLARRQLTIDPLREEAHRQVMQALALAKRPGEALAHYDQLVELLRTELDVAPATATTALYASLCGGVQAAPLSPRPTSPTSGRPRPIRNLPHQFTPFIGREKMLELLDIRLSQPECRLLTLVGSGGVGKTRLAIEAARRQADSWADGVFFLDLAPLDGVDQLPPALANGLGLSLPPQAQTEQERQDALIHLLAGRELLLVLDNYEHLLPHTQLVTALLQGTSHLCLLVTSRVPLDLRAEWLVDVAGLPAPPEETSADAVTAAGFASVALFEQAATRVKYDFAPTSQERMAVARICRLLEGSPLALELAAARVREHSVESVADAIAIDLDFLSTGMVDVPVRHRSLRAAIDHSWQLLPAEQRAVFARLALFRGSFSLDAAQQIAGASRDHLEALTLHSLLRPAEADRYALHESLRQFVAEKLAEVPAAQGEIQRRYAIYYLALLAAQEGRLLGASSPAVLTELFRDYNNLRGAWSSAVVNGNVDSLNQALEAAYRFFNATGLVQDGRAAIEQALASPFLTQEDEWQGADNGTKGVSSKERSAAGGRSSDKALVVARLLVKKARFLNTQGQFELTLQVAQKAAEMLATEYSATEHSTADIAGKVRGHGGAHLLATVGDAWLQWGRATLHLGRYDQAADYLEDALGAARSADNAQLEAEVHTNLGTLHNLQNNFTLAHSHNAKALELARQSGDRYTEGIALNNLGAVADYQGEYATAADYMEQALAVFDTLGYRRGSANALSNLGAVSAWLGKLEKAVTYHWEGLQTAREIGDIDGEAWALMALGAVYTHLGRLDDARTHLRDALVLNSQDGTRTVEAWTLYHLAQVELDADELDQADDLARRAHSLAEELSDELTMACALQIRGEIAARRGGNGQAEAAFAQALDVNQRLEHRAGQMRVLAAWARHALAQDTPSHAAALTNDALALAGADDLLLDRAPLLFVRGQALAAVGKHADAERVLQEALALHRQMGQMHLAAKVQDALGRINVKG